MHPMGAYGLDGPVRDARYVMQRHGAEDEVEPLPGRQSVREIEQPRLDIGGTAGGDPLRT
jgi:hypothetical protein